MGTLVMILGALLYPSVVLAAHRRGKLPPLIGATLTCVLLVLMVGCDSSIETGQRYVDGAEVDVIRVSFWTFDPVTGTFVDRVSKWIPGKDFELIKVVAESGLTQPTEAPQEPSFNGFLLYAPDPVQSTLVATVDQPDESGADLTLRVENPAGLLPPRSSFIAGDANDDAAYLLRLVPDPHQRFVGSEGNFLFVRVVQDG